MKHFLGISSAFSLALIAIAATGCMGGTRQAGSKSFDLSQVESSLASDYEQEDPREGGAQGRCDYWKKRKADAVGSHKVGSVLWPAEHFNNLREWVGAMGDELCSMAAAQAEQEKKAKERAEAERADKAAKEAAAAEAERKRQEAAKEWKLLDVEACSNPVRKDADRVRTACTAVARFAREYPDSPHADEAAETAKAGFRTAEHLEAEANKARAAEERRREAADQARARDAEASKRRSACMAGHQQKCNAQCRANPGCLKLCMSNQPACN